MLSDVLFTISWLFTTTKELMHQKRPFFRGQLFFSDLTINILYQKTFLYKRLTCIEAEEQTDQKTYETRGRWRRRRRRRRRRKRGGKGENSKFRGFSRTNGAMRIFPLWSKWYLLQHSDAKLNGVKLGENIAMRWSSAGADYDGDGATKQWYSEIGVHDFTSEPRSLASGG